MTLASDVATISFHEPDGVVVRGTLVLLPGRGEAGSVYQRFGRRLAADAYRVHVVAAPTADPDLARDRIGDLFSSADPNLPRVLIGSDAGAAFAAHAVATGAAPGVSGLVLAGLPTLARGVPERDWDAELDARTSCPAHRARISDAGVVAPAELFTGLPEEWLDPGVPARLRVPVLGVHGQDDVVSPFEQVRRWYAAVPRVELFGVAGGRHDALNDQTHRSVAATVVLFLERLRLGPGLLPIVVPEPLPSASRGRSAR